VGDLRASGFKEKAMALLDIVTIDPFANPLHSKNSSAILLARVNLAAENIANSIRYVLRSPRFVGVFRHPSIQGIKGIHMNRIALSTLVFALAASQANAGQKTIASPFHHVAFSYDDASWVYAESVLTMRGAGITFAIQELPHIAQLDTAEKVLDKFDANPQLRPGLSQSISKKLDAVATPIGWGCRSYERKQEGQAKAVGLSRICAIVGKDHFEFLSIEIPGDRVDKDTVVRLNGVIASIKHA
jgi:hypothetical protein